MNFNFELILFYLVLVSGVITAADVVYFAPKRKANGQTQSLIIEYGRSFFPVLLFVFMLRSFFFETFRIPSGSLEPTLLIGDFIAVNKYAYGIRLPVSHKKIFSVGEPKRGDIFVFYWPPNPSFYLIKRVVGLPGDKISYVNKAVFVNGQPMAQSFADDELFEEKNRSFDVTRIKETLYGLKHEIYVSPLLKSFDFKNLTVPIGMYFAMGDNRDFSADSRYFGFVPEGNIVGRADIKWFSWNSGNYSVRWNRLFTRIV